jgi:hypothetical protein
MFDIDIVTARWIVSGGLGVWAITILRDIARSLESIDQRLKGDAARRRLKETEERF